MKRLGFLNLLGVIWLGWSRIAGLKTSAPDGDRVSADAESQGATSDRHGGAKSGDRTRSWRYSRNLRISAKADLMLLAVSV